MKPSAIARVPRWLVTVALVAALGSGAPSPGHAAQVREAVCLVDAGPADGLALDVVRAALALESRKAGVPLALTAPACPDGAAIVLTLGPGPVVVLSEVPGEAEALALGDVPAPDRAGEVARAAIARLRSTAAAAWRLEPLFDPDLPVTLPASARPLATGSLGVEPGGLLLVGGGYAYGVGAGSHRAVVDGEAALTLFGGAFALGVAGGWSPGLPSAGGDPSVAVVQGEILGMARGGLRLGPVRLRIGVGGGWQWRRITAQADVRFDTVERRSGAAGLALECDALLPVGDLFVIALALPGRVWFGGDDYTWNGRVVYAAPRGAVGLSLRVGVAL